MPKLTTPISDEEIRSLKAGDTVYLNGIIVTGRDAAHKFMIENFIVSTIGLIIGGILSVGLNIAMVEAFALKPLAWYVIPIAMVALWIVGQAAVAGPARRASNISPAIATRSI